MTPKQERYDSLLPPLNDKYETFRNNVPWENYRGRSLKGRTMLTPTSTKAVNREPFKEVLVDSLQVQSISSSSPTRAAAAGLVFKESNPHVLKESNRHQEKVSPAVEFDEMEKEKFELMNIKIVVYGLTGLMCERDPVKKRLFGRKDSLSAAGTGETSGKRSVGFSGSSISSGDLFSMGEADSMETNPVTTTAVVSCQKNAISSQTSLETFVPSLPILRPVAAFVNKVRYIASWPSEQSTLQQDDGAMDFSSFQIIRCMQQATFVPGIGVGSNYVHETVELRINLSRGTELIRLGTASLVINGDEEGEAYMTLPARPILLDGKKMKKKKNKRNKYGYFSDDLSRRFFLDDNSTLKVGVQVIPEEALRFAQEKDKMKQELEWKQILKQDDLKELLRQMGNDNLDRAQKIEIKTITANLLAKESSRALHRLQEQQVHPPQHQDLGQRDRKSLFPDIFCGAIPLPKMPSFCVASPFTNTETAPEIPKEIHTDHDLDQFPITSIISSVSESTDGSFVDFDDE